MKIDYNPRRANRKEAKLSAAPVIIKEVAKPIKQPSKPTKKTRKAKKVK